MPPQITIIQERMNSTDLYGPFACSVCGRLFETGETWTRSTILLPGQHSGQAYGQHTPNCAASLEAAPIARALHPIRSN